MMLTMLYSKLYRARVTLSKLDYNGSLGIDRDLMDAANMLPGQQIDVLNVSNGERFTTYILEEPRGSKTIGVYGAAAHKATAGDIVIVIAYAHLDETEARRYKPIVLTLDEKNNVVNNG